MDKNPAIDILSSFQIVDLGRDKNTFNMGKYQINIVYECNS